MRKLNSNYINKEFHKLFGIIYLQLIRIALIIKNK